MFGSRTSSRRSHERIAKYSYLWKSSKEAFMAWDSEAKEEIELDANAVLIPLTSTMMITGSRPRGKGASLHYTNVYSNEFTNFDSDIVTVIENDGFDGTKTEIVKGVYSPAVKETIADLPYANFTKVVYCLYGEDVVRLQLRSSSLRPWIEFENKLREKHIDLYHGHGIKLNGVKEGSFGSVSYKTPVFAAVEIDSKDDARATEKAIEVEDAILRNLQSNGTTEAPAEVPTNTRTDTQSSSDGEEISLEDIPF